MINLKSSMIAHRVQSGRPDEYYQEQNRVATDKKKSHSIAEREEYVDEHVLALLPEIISEETIDIKKLTDVRAQYYKLLEARKIVKPKEAPRELEYWLSNKAFKHALPESSDSVFLPGIPHASRRMLEFKLKASHMLNKRFPVPQLTDENPYPDSLGVARDYSMMMCIPGYTPDTAGVVTPSNKEYRKHIGLSNKWFSKEEQSMFEDWVDILMGAALPKRITVKAKSRSGLPYNHTARGLKTLDLLYAIYHRKYLYKLLEEKNFHKVLSEFNIICAYHPGVRLMPDRPDKQREVLDIKSLINGKDVYKIVNKEVKLPKIPVAISKHFSPMRYRYVFAANSTMNYMMDAVVGSNRNAYGKIFAFGLKHQTKEQIEEKIKVAVGVPKNKMLNRSDVEFSYLDVTQFDRSYPDYWAKCWFRSIQDYPFAQIFGHNVWAPIVSGTNDRGTPPIQQVIWRTGDPMNYDFTKMFDMSLASGTTLVSNAAKLTQLDIYLLICKIFRQKPSFTHFLKGAVGTWDAEEWARIGNDSSIRFLCLTMGDDIKICWFGGSQSYLKKYFDHAIKSIEHAHTLAKEGKKVPVTYEDYEGNNQTHPITYSNIIYGLEPGARFIGYIDTCDTTGNFKTYNDRSTHVSNFLANEQSITHRSRRDYWALGWVLREGNYDAPEIGKQTAILDEAFQQIFGYSFVSTIRTLAEEQLKNLTLNSGRNERERVILDAILKRSTIDQMDQDTSSILNDILRDPSVLDYKYDLDELDKAFNIDLATATGAPPIFLTYQLLRDAGFAITKEGEEEGKKGDIIWVKRKILNCGLSIMEAYSIAQNSDTTPSALGKGYQLREVSI